MRKTIVRKSSGISKNQEVCDNQQQLDPKAREKVKAGEQRDGRL